MSKGLMVAGLAGGSGKSVVSVGLTAALSRRGRTVVPFKKGPDYIDAGWMKLAAGRSCYNLDPFLMEESVIRASFQDRGQEGERLIVEGNRGLYDGVNATGGYSSAELAIMLNLPVLLVVNCTKTTRTVAALVMGCQQFDPQVNICGVVLNQIGGARHRAIVTEAVEHYTGLPVVGAIPRLKRDIFPMRHLGVTPHQEYDGADAALELLADTIDEHLDVERIEDLMFKIPASKNVIPNTFGVEAGPASSSLRIGYLMDAAFQFYYAENLEALEAAGAELVPVNALSASKLPDLDGLYIGGGFPETSAADLAANEGFRHSVRAAVESGLPVYAECGGLIYLGESIVLDGVEHQLAGVFPVRFGLSKRPQAHGYSIFRAEQNNPFYPVGAKVKGHEFRYSTILSWSGNPSELVLRMDRGTGFIGGRDGLCRNNVLALYTHIHALGTPEWAVGFVARCRATKS
ncbi:MAG: cobyrinate a,c-diamide synthase [Desulfobulbaceae bacterium]|uniref:Cobyrinate a,c-diamide synthase n=1 Tax=Candidatus Desulfatifera sulfidica TaxID=2841691 RepID=A0A8J6NCD7_9BACT|nr:cobyrinate a,c-diamide synthase [Candidatus Desulfatifera sulfidica]